jgi:hypothetical protein
MRRSRGGVLYFAAMAASLSGSVHACGSFGSNSVTPESDGGNGPSDGGSLSDGSSDSAQDSGCTMLLDERFDNDFGILKEPSTIPPGSSITVDGGALVATLVPSGASEAQVEITFADALATGRIEIAFLVKDFASLPSNWATSVVGCSAQFNLAATDVELQFKLKSDNTLNLVTTGATQLESIALGSAPKSASAASFLMTLSLANGVVTARGAIDGGALSQPVRGPSETNALRIKCGIEYARATADGGSLKQSIDWAQVRHCP